jgi:hypothetical protein
LVGIDTHGKTNSSIRPDASFASELRYQVVGHHTNQSDLAHLRRLVGAEEAEVAVQC